MRHDVSKAADKTEVSFNACSFGHASVKSWRYQYHHSVGTFCREFFIVTVFFGTCSNDIATLIMIFMKRSDYMWAGLNTRYDDYKIDDSAQSFATPPFTKRAQPITEWFRPKKAIPCCNLTHITSYTLKQSAERKSNVSGKLVIRNWVNITYHKSVFHRT
jgi:hypothetical protein